MDIGLLILRGTFGLLMAGHGAQKLFGWFGGYGLSGTGGFFATMGFRPGPLFAFLAGFTELAGGLLLTLGFLGPVGPLLIIAVMVVAALAVHAKNGLWVTSNGIEVPLLFGAVAAGLAFTGYGAWSLDVQLGVSPLWADIPGWLTIAIGTIGGLLALAVRRAPAAAPVGA